MATRTLDTTEATTRKAVAIPMAQPEGEVLVTLSFTPAEWDVIREAVANEASSWRVVRTNKSQRDYYEKVDAKRAQKDLGARKREYVGNYIYTGGKAKKYRHTLGATAVVLKYARLGAAAAKIGEALKALAK